MSYVNVLCQLSVHDLAVLFEIFIVAYIYMLLLFSVKQLD